MQDVQIGKAEAHYWLPQSLLAERKRLDQIHSRMFAEAFELALEHCGVPQDGELCIRKIYAPVHLRLTNTDDSLARDWSLVLAVEIARELRRGRASNIVFYHSRRQALMDLTIGIARGDLRRAWAWRQLGFWRTTEQASETEAAFELTRTLCAEAAMVIPAFQAMAEAGLLERFFSRLATSQLAELALAALSEAGLSSLPDESGRAPSSRVIQIAMRVLKGSRLLRAITASRSMADESPELCRALAAWTVLDAEPVQLQARNAPELINLIASAIRSARTQVIIALPEPTDIAATDFSEQPREIEQAAWLERQAEPNQEAAQISDLRQRAVTRFGGLLFLLGIVEDLKLPEAILAHATLGLRPFNWVMHALALALVDAEPDDAAALAFAGLLPDSVAPSLDQQMADEVEAEAIHALRLRIIERLSLCLERPNESERLLLEFVCHRRAEIVGDPGWIDVKLSLDEVSTEIRSAGLDLNPGYLSWLGVVVRFVYE